MLLILQKVVDHSRILCHC